MLKSPHLINCSGAHLNILMNTAILLIDNPYEKKKSYNLQSQGINLEDLSVCLKIVYDLKLGNFSFSLDPYEETNPDGPW